MNDDNLLYELTLLRKFRDFVMSAPVGSGICCCGDDMENHSSGWICGHEAVDQWNYSLLCWQKEFDAIYNNNEETK